jgi:2-polyprenyl-6-methoxyphenol hydroxylase-like FAD-dependent oxidoreductase
MVRNERVLIVGGGIGGLAVAAGLRRLGLTPTLVEKTKHFEPIGAGIGLSVNAMAAMRQLGLAEATMSAGRSTNTAEITNQHGACLSRVHLDRLAEEFGPTIAIHRADLHEVLLSGCDGLELKTGTSVDRLVDRGEVVEVEFSDGSKREFDRVIGADGLRSRTRLQAFGETQPIYSGYSCWRFVVDCPAGLDRMQEMLGRGLRFGLVPLSKNRVYCFTCVNVAPGTPDPEDGRVERFRARFSGFGGFAPAALEQIVRPEQLIHNDLEEMPVHPWSKGRVLLIGDAAHATTPNMGQGAAMVLEDAVVLCEMLSGADAWDDVIPAFIERREPRVRFIVDQSRRIGRVAMAENRVLTTLRDWMMWAMPERIADHGARRAAAAEV